jgi:hypothetical protein
LIGLSKITGALSLVKVETNGSLLEDTKLAIAVFSNWPSVDKI